MSAISAEQLEVEIHMKARNQEVNISEVESYMIKQARKYISGCIDVKPRNKPTYIRDSDTYVMQSDILRTK